ncbi:Acyl-lipid (8-3)-desaturase B, partial [Dissostichus eleginoides]
MSHLILPERKESESNEKRGMAAAKSGGAVVAKRAGDERRRLVIAESKSNRMMESRGMEEHKHYSRELGWNESLIVGRGPMTNADSPTVHSSFIAAKLQDEAPEAWWRWDEIKIKEKREDMLVILAGPDGPGSQRMKRESGRKKECERKEVQHPRTQAHPGVLYQTTTSPQEKHKHPIISGDDTKWDDKTSQMLASPLFPPCSDTEKLEHGTENPWVSLYTYMDDEDAFGVPLAWRGCVGQEKEERYELLWLGFHYWVECRDQMDSGRKRKKS